MDKSKIYRTGPGFINDAAGTVFSLAVANVMVLIRQIILCNETETDSSFSLWIANADSADDPGTAIFRNKIIKANETLTFFYSPGLRLNSTEFLVGQAADVNIVTITAAFEMHLLDLV